MSRWLTILLAAAKNWKADNEFKHAAAVSFYTLFSLAPITIIAITVAGIFLGKATATAQLTKQVAALVGPGSAERVQAAAKASETEGTGAISTVIGVALLLFGATTCLDSSRNRSGGGNHRRSLHDWALPHRALSRSFHGGVDLWRGRLARRSPDLGLLFVCDRVLRG